MENFISNNKDFNNNFSIEKNSILNKNFNNNNNNINNFKNIHHKYNLSFNESENNSISTANNTLIEKSFISFNDKSQIKNKSVNKENNNNPIKRTFTFEKKIYKKNLPLKHQATFKRSVNNNNNIFHKEFNNVIKPTKLDFNNNNDNNNNYFNPNDSILNNTFSNLFPNEENINNNINNNNNNINNNNNNNNNNINLNIKTAILNIEDILLFEEKTTNIRDSLQNTLECHNECFDYWNFYFTSSLHENLENYFVDEKNKTLILLVIRQNLLSIMLCYDISFHDEIFKELIIHLRELMRQHHIILMLISKFLYNKIIFENNENIWIKKLEILIKKYIFENNRTTPKTILDTIKCYCFNINNLQRIILHNYGNLIQHCNCFSCSNFNNNNLIKEFYNIFKNINSSNIYDLNIFFKEKVYRILNKNGSNLAMNNNYNNYYNNNFNNNNINNFLPVPYLNKQNLKKYTLVLDLDETLIHFKFDPIDEKKAMLHLRPGLFEFLDDVSHYYELVIFTSSLQDYADPILDVIEKNRIYFDYRLYRQHTIIIGNDFVKDISKLGRDMSKIIIVDNMSQNFQLQKENGICIKSFWGKDNFDYNLTDLAPILIEIAEKNMDVRYGIKYFKDEIINKVSSSMYRTGQI